jgi:tRNA-Thr(GGU) m(6)t(6)A37 methyltransferase TsaA
MTEDYHFFPVGKVRKHGGKASIEVFRQYEEALLGLDEFSHIAVLFWFHKNDTPHKRHTLQVHPRGNRKNPLRGIFATRSPVRPNLIGLSTCKIMSVTKSRIKVDGIDAFDGTPVLDIKPCTSARDLEVEVRVPDLVED